MGYIHIQDLPVATDLGSPPDEDDVLLICDVSTRITKRITVNVLLKSIPVKDLLEHVYRRLKERRKR